MKSLESGFGFVSHLNVSDVILTFMYVCNTFLLHAHCNCKTLSPDFCYLLWFECLYPPKLIGQNPYSQSDGIEKYGFFFRKGLGH